MISQNMDSVLNRGIVSGYWATFFNVIYPTAWLYYDWLQASSYMTVSDWLLPHYIVIFLRQCMFLDDWNWTVNINIYWILCRLYCIYWNLSLLDFVIISSYTLMDLCFMEHVFYWLVFATNMDNNSSTSSERTLCWVSCSCGKEPGLFHHNQIDSGIFFLNRSEY